MKTSLRRSSAAAAMLLFAALTLAHGSGHDDLGGDLGGGDDMGMMDGMGGAPVLAEGMMIPYLHFSPGDTLWFQGWVPQTKAAVTGVCVGLFLLGLVDRWLAAVRSSAEKFWWNRSQIAIANRLNYAPLTGKSQASAATASQAPDRLTLGNIVRSTIAAPFIPTHDIARGVLHTAQAALGFLFMLAVM
jgi:copper transporter 1